MLSVYSRHYPPCTSDDINYKRCRCPKWVNGLLGSAGPFIRRSAKTRSWEKAEEFKRELEAEYDAKQNGAREVVDVATESFCRYKATTTCNLLDFNGTDSPFLIL